MILARSTKTNARRKEGVIEEISAKISLTLEAEYKITLPKRQNHAFNQNSLLGVLVCDTFCLFTFYTLEVTSQNLLNRRSFDETS